MTEYEYNGKKYSAVVAAEADTSLKCDGCAFQGNQKGCDEAPNCWNDKIEWVWKEAES